MTIANLGSPRTFCTFRLGEQLMGIDLRDVKEVTTLAACTRVPHAPPDVLGLVNVRGQIYLILDLKCLLGLPEATLTPESRLILFHAAVGNSFGIVVDSIAGIHAVQSNQIEPFGAAGHQDLEMRPQRVDLIAAVCTLPEQLFVVLNSRRFLTIVEQNLATLA